MNETVHDCLCYKTNITMADGSKKKIMDIQKGNYVLGMDLQGKVIPSLVTDTFYNGTCERWVTVTGKRRKAGRGNSTWNVHCTPNHCFWNPTRKAYVSAECLRQGDLLFLIRHQLVLTPLQEQILIGKMLGDATLHRTVYGSAGIEWGQKAEHVDYVYWTLRGLGDIAYSSTYEAISGYGTLMTRASTTFHPAILSLFKDWIGTDAKKHVPMWVSDKISPITMAFWYMDDGSLSYHADQEDRALLATCAFTEDDCKVLQKGLARFDIQARYYQSEEKDSRLRLNADDAEKFFLLISPYVPACMQYKLPERYRGHVGWLPSAENIYKPILVVQEVEQVSTNETIMSARWNIETRTHNFFANSILVQDSNVHVNTLDVEREEPDQAKRPFLAPWTRIDS